MGHSDSSWYGFEGEKCYGIGYSKDTYEGLAFPSLKYVRGTKENLGVRVTKADGEIDPKTIILAHDEIFVEGEIEMGRNYRKNYRFPRFRVTKLDKYRHAKTKFCGARL